jgi:hypothetical protein
MYKFKLLFLAFFFTSLAVCSRLFVPSRTDDSPPTSRILRSIVFYSDSLRIAWTQNWRRTDGGFYSQLDFEISLTDNAGNIYFFKRHRRITPFRHKKGFMIPIPTAPNFYYLSIRACAVDSECSLPCSAQANSNFLGGFFFNVAFTDGVFFIETKKDVSGDETIKR